jgi:pimeloyl-ACP methyl ester carboxylesterase
MSEIEYDGFKLAYRAVGAGRPAILLIHGLGGNGDVWRYQSEYFEDKNRIVAVDLFGHGRSSKDVPVDDIIELNTGAIETLIKMEINGPYILVGHSYAGNILPGLIGSAGDNLVGAVFVECIYQEQDEIIAMREKFARTMLALNDQALEKETRRWYLEMTYGRADQDDCHFILSSLNDCNCRWLFESVQFSCAFNRRRKHETTPLREDLEIMVVEADRGDCMTFNRSWVNHYKNARYYLFEKSNHFLFVTQRDKFNRLLEEFVGECPT